TTLTRTVIQSSEVDSAPIAATSAATVFVTLFAQDVGSVTVSNTVDVNVGADVVESAGLNALAVAITEGSVSISNNEIRELGRVSITGTPTVAITHPGGPLAIQIANDD